MRGLNGTHYMQMLAGQIETGSNFYIDDSCKNNHGNNGKTVRYKSGKCVFCMKVATSRAALKAEQGIAGVNKKVAIDHLREEMEIKKISEESFLTE